MWRSIISIVALSSIACALREKQEASDLLSLVANNPDLSIFYEAVQKAGVGPLLQSKQATTVFAPTNEAFGTEPMSSFKLKYLLDGANKKTLEMLVKYHIGTSVETVAGAPGLLYTYILKRACPPGLRRRMCVLQI